MPGGLLDLAGESGALNSKLFSLPRLLILSALDPVPKGDLTPFRDLSRGLGLNDGVLFANLKVLIKMGYAIEEPIKEENEKMTGYAITDVGRLELRRIVFWIGRWAGGMGYGKSGQSDSVLQGAGHQAKGR
ncbi:TPA: transcriptional regulator [Candidatus Woesearchaeota archaeon]|nr:transcriptional regulator [Candidatus Woesearchaeota archaeon]